MLIQLLLWIGIVSRNYDGQIKWPFHVSPRHMWLYLAKHEPIFGVFRNRPGVVKWVPGRLLPWRWGFRLWIFEIGDRGSHHWDRRTETHA